VFKLCDVWIRLVDAVVVGAGQGLRLFVERGKTEPSRAQAVCVLGKVEGWQAARAAGVGVVC